MEDKKSMEVATDQNEGYEFDEGIEPTPEEIEAAKKLAEQEVQSWEYIMCMVDTIGLYREQDTIWTK